MRLLAPLAALLMLVTACGSDSSSTPAPSVTVTATTTATTTATASETASASPAEPSTSSTPEADPADRRTWRTPETTITVKRSRQDVSEYGKQPGTRLDAVLVRTCIKVTGGGSVSWSPWSLVDKRDGRYPASSSTWSDFPLPEYPFAGVQIGEGECAQGWIVFRVPAKCGKAVALVYDNGSRQHRWNLG
ncbi:hypothetical protein [Nocardioides bruguierae]|uniref:DUF4352 domain-containing protein n=1 Tax=Nocardioides bruguierae TaxID=2945102 RepID=A0A9X2DAJ7_9ACTN|nr:hypothetical protein [Nocardioides bruguierae]MCM0622347.1 hypothetical protein [Nocardioides bruguierae]